MKDYEKDLNIANEYLNNAKSKAAKQRIKRLINRIRRAQINSKFEPLNNLNKEYPTRSIIKWKNKK